MGSFLSFLPLPLHPPSFSIPVLFFFPFSSPLLFLQARDREALYHKQHPWPRTLVFFYRIVQNSIWLLWEEPWRKWITYTDCGLCHPYGEQDNNFLYVIKPRYESDSRKSLWLHKGRLAGSKTQWLMPADLIMLTWKSCVSWCFIYSVCFLFFACSLPPAKIWIEFEIILIIICFCVCYKT